MFGVSSKRAIIASLLLTVFIWGANNIGVKVLVSTWPPGWVAATRFICAGLLMLGLLRFTSWLGTRSAASAKSERRLWLRGGASLAVYIVVYNLALRYTAASHVALYLAASPVWALLWEKGITTGPLSARVRSVLAAFLTISGVTILLWPAIESTHASAPGELLGFAAGVLWTIYGRECRMLGASLTGAEIAAHTMLRAGVLLAPIAVIEVLLRGLAWRTDLVLVQGYCVIGAGVIGFSLWSNALRRWKTSEVYLFANLIPVTTMFWGRLLLNEPVTPTFWAALVLVITGVVIGQTNWEKFFGSRWPAPD